MYEHNLIEVNDLPTVQSVNNQLIFIPCKANDAVSSLQLCIT